MPPVTDNVKHIGDGISISTMLAAVAGWLPALAALVTIIWTGIRIYETRTVQRRLKQWRKRRG